jgi:DNA-binding MarR family transcriptional regulator
METAALATETDAMTSPELPEGLADPSGFLGYNLMRAAHLVRGRHDIVFKSELGINIRQFGALVALLRSPGLGSGELARNLSITAQSAGPLVAALEALGYVERDRDAPPGLRMGMRATVAGAAAARRGHELIRRLEADYEASLTPEGFAELKRLLQQLANKVAETSAMRPCGDPELPVRSKP